jgi:hypothetical protein
LEEWALEEWGIIEKMDAPFSVFLSMLSEGLPIGDMQSRINAPAFWREQPSTAP